MVDPRLLRENPNLLRRGCKAKGVEVDIDALIRLDERRRSLIGEVEGIRAEKNRVGREIAKARGEEKASLIARMKEVTAREKDLAAELTRVEEEFYRGLALVPNPPLPDVPVGPGESANTVIREVAGSAPAPAGPVRDYMEIARACDCIDTERAAKVSGTRFGYLKNEAVLLEFALVRHALKRLTEAGFVPVVPPVMLRREPMEAMGYMARGEDEVYRTQDDLYLVGTSEQSLGAYLMDEIIPEDRLPVRMCAFSTCFRREAGSYGKDTKGILRVHQFDKVEMFSFCHPARSVEEHRLILSLQERLVSDLGLSYRVVQIGTGDLGDPAAAKFDIECWMPGQNAYRETHSCSNCTDFQARSLRVRYRPSDGGELEFVHTLNGTAYAIGRTLIAIIETYQTQEGGFIVPPVLRPYLDGLEVVRPRR